MSSEVQTSAAPQFCVGQRVIVDRRTSQGHCRTPVYLRGHQGVVLSIPGLYRDPEKLAYHKPGIPMRRLYRVSFNQRSVWPNYHGDACDTLEADIYEDWLIPADGGMSS